MAKISVEGNVVNTGFGINGGHLYLVFTDDDGLEYAISGQPIARPPYGFTDNRLGVYYNYRFVSSPPGTPSLPDIRVPGLETPETRDARTLDLGGRDANDVWQILVKYAQLVDGAAEAEALEYNSVSQNSNSLIGTLLRLIGLNIESYLPVNAQKKSVLPDGSIQTLPIGTAGFIARENWLDFDFTLYGTDGDDIITAKPTETDYGNQDFPLPIASKQQLYGYAGSDILFGGAGADTLEGGAGDDLLIGGTGDDKFLASGDIDTIIGGDGEDSYSLAPLISGGFSFGLSRVDANPQSAGFEARINALPTSSGVKASDFTGVNDWIKIEFGGHTSYVTGIERLALSNNADGINVAGAVASLAGIPLIIDALDRAGGNQSAADFDTADFSGLSAGVTDELPLKIENVENIILTQFNDTYAVTVTRAITPKLCEPLHSRLSPLPLEPSRQNAHLRQMLIETETTPNPATLKFMPGRAVMDSGTRDFASHEEAEASPLAEALFGLGDVEGVFFGRDFVSVTATPTVEWPHLKPDVLSILLDHFSANMPLFKPATAAGFSVPDAGEHDGYDPADEDIVVQIKELIETRVRPAVANDGGDIIFKGYDAGRVWLKMQGACAGCPSSTATLKQGIESLLKHYVPEVTEVLAA
jgi:Fe-S cluster biogenesis protein NfuA